MEWIECSQKLPPCGKKVLVGWPEGFAVAHRVCEKIHYWDQVNETTKKRRTEDNWYWEGDGDCYLTTHWTEVSPPAAIRESRDIQMTTELGIDWTIENDGSVTHNPGCNCGCIRESGKE